MTFGADLSQLKNQGPAMIAEAIHTHTCARPRGHISFFFSGKKKKKKGINLCNRNIHKQMTPKLLLLLLYQTKLSEASVYKCVRPTAV